MIFKTEDHSKVFLGANLLKTIKDISEINKTGQSLTQRYYPTLKWEMYNVTGKPRQNVQPYPQYQQKKPKHRFSKDTVMPNH